MAIIKVEQQKKGAVQAAPYHLIKIA